MKPASITTIKPVIMAGLLLGSVFVAGADPVVFNVNMSVQSALGNFNAGNGDGVRVLGLNGDWSTGVTLVPSSTDTNTYAVTNDLAAWSWPNYKFVITPGSGSWIWESPASFGGGNRWFQVPAGGTNLPVVYFSDATNAVAVFQITFQLSMWVPAALGSFTIGADYVDAFGSWNNWSSSDGLLLTNVPGTSNYVGTLITTNTLDGVLFYKYAINGYYGTWEGNVGPSNTVNRTIALTNATMVVPLEYWNNIFSITNSYPVKFSVNMLVEYALGVFDPTNNLDSVCVFGDWNWNGTPLSLYQSDDPYVYTNTVPLMYTEGTLVNYKYALNAGLTWENNNVGPGGSQNRQFTLMTTNLPSDYFNNYADLGPLTISLSGDQTALFWASGSNANNHIRLQNSTNLLSGWADVPNTEGTDTITNNFGSGSQFFRLIGP